jgi:hypothetical protein
LATSLVVNRIKVVKGTVHLSRALLSPTDRLLCGLFYEPMSSVFHDKTVNLDDYLRDLEAFEARENAPKLKIAKTISNLLSDHKTSKMMLDTEVKLAAKKYDTAEMHRFLLEFVQRLTLVNGELEVSFEEEVDASPRAEIDDGPSVKSVNSSGIGELSLSLVGRN